MLLSENQTIQSDVNAKAERKSIRKFVFKEASQTNISYKTIFTTSGWTNFIINYFLIQKLKCFFNKQSIKFPWKSK